MLLRWGAAGAEEEVAVVTTLGGSVPGEKMVRSSAAADTPAVRTLGSFESISSPSKRYKPTFL